MELENADPHIYANRLRDLGERLVHGAPAEVQDIQLLDETAELLDGHTLTHVEFTAGVN